MKGPAVNRAELLKWWDALDTITGQIRSPDVALGLEMARLCEDEDAQWLASLFPAGTVVTPESLQEAMLAQGEDPRAIYIASRTGGLTDYEMLRQAAELGYAPAQAKLAMSLDETDWDIFEWAQKAAVQGNRLGFLAQGDLLMRGWYCHKDPAQALASWKKAAELECCHAEYQYGLWAFGERDWERYYWWARAAVHGYYNRNLLDATILLSPEFERGECGRILHALGSLFKANPQSMTNSVHIGALQSSKLQRMMILYEAMLSRARQAIGTWSVIGRRLKVVKDIRVKIAKMAWEEAWRWGEKE